MKTVDIHFDNGPIRLAGSLSVPDETAVWPAVLLISGSGPIDRDSNMKKLKIDVMRQIAQRLAAGGFASLRYDKRGVGASTGDFLATGFHDNVADAQAALDALRSRPGIDPGQVFVLGHSEGALIAAELAAANPDLAGAVLVAGAAQPGEAVLRWQAGQVAATLPRPVKLLMKLLRQDVARTQAKRLRQIKATDGDTARIQLVKLNARWFREFLVHDPAATLRHITVPVLAVTGAKDIQVDPLDVERIRELVDAPCTARIISDMTHLLRLEPGEPSVRTYKKQATREVDRGLTDLVVSWMARQPAVVDS